MLGTNSPQQRNAPQDNNPFTKITSFFNQDTSFDGSRGEEKQINSAFNNFMENEGRESNFERNEMKNAFGGLFAGIFGGDDEEYRPSVDPFDSYSGRPDSSQRNDNDFGQATSRRSFR